MNTGLNRALLNTEEVDQAILWLQEKGIGLHSDRPKNWDLYYFINLLSHMPKDSIYEFTKKRKNICSNCNQKSRG